ncbi:MAG: HNH endonuclease [Roseiarcus sp.]|jgi:hypothetical protein
MSINGLAGIGNEEFRKITVWLKGTPIAGYPESVWRHDAFGSVIKYSDYGNRSSEWGWEIDHYPVPVGLGGTDAYSNLRPLHWRNNASHGGLLSNALSSFGKS